ncbi:MAG: helix-turn-helix domain-containing protein [Candidatus Eremiobacteraeota bacterium]|nr:helix-turn-helix domain-containing protein [Candidatus Eremiobacteraeota bacterium]MBV8354042.1 helix-turn-helix domain-containing protein [Candidatus Eremiobacteraeota bacterium]
MQPFFETSRGRIVAALRRKRSASAVDLANEFDLSPNAIRQQLAVLEREGLVTERSVRRGKTKPTHEFSLSAEGERLFPQHYDRLLTAVLREVRAAGGDSAVAGIFERIGKKAAERARADLEGKAPEERVGAIIDLLGHRGVEATWTREDAGFVIHEHNCPYAETVKEHPQVCSVIHSVLEEAFPHGSAQTESLATGGNECRFEIKA